MRYHCDHAEMMPSAIAAPSLAAHVIMETVGKGLPLFRLEDGFKRDGVSIDRATLPRYQLLGLSRPALRSGRAATAPR